MGDQIQHQLAQLVNLFQEERAANIARQEAINACLDALTKDLANSKVDIESTEMQEEVPSFGIQSWIFHGLLAKGTSLF